MDSSSVPEVVDTVIAFHIAVDSREYASKLDINSDDRVTSLDVLMILPAASA